MIPSVQIEAVTFDVGGTLIEPQPSVGHIYADIAARHGMTGLSADLLNQRFDKAWRALKTFHHTRAEWAELVDATFHGLSQTPPDPEFFTELYSRFAQADAWRVFEDVLPSLDWLASHGLKLGVISNWDERLRPLLRQLGLHDYFDAIVISCNVGFSKPSPVIFEHAAEKLALPPQNILHVGDSLELDVHGARAAGMRALELRRAAEHLQDQQLDSLLRLKHLLER